MYDVGTVVYSDRPRRSQPRRQTPAEEHPAMVSSSELGRVVADLLPFEALSLSDPPLLTPQTADADETDDDEVSPEPVGFGYGTFGPQTLRYSAHPPRPKWFGGVRGQTMLEEHAGDASSSELDPINDSSRSEELSLTVSSLSRSEKPIEDPDDDTEEELRLLQEYFDANPPTSISQALDEIDAANHAAFVSLAAELGMKPPPPPQPRRQFLADQAQQKDSATVAHPQHSTKLYHDCLVRKCRSQYRREASVEEIVENAKKWMREEVTVVFQNYIGRRDDLKIVDYRLDELCHQCVSVENYHNVFHHYNFTMKLKKANSDDWIGALYFAEVKQTFGRKSYFCCPLEPNENGLCYACENQGMDGLRHPATGGFDKGLPGVNFGLWYSDEW
ncbi:unnamed protein product [Urochloa decumbens]|uniref:DUF3615 domain-containing protein n=1 Tax=Urochloa decumbens TaxID=240449 RepID=A0ABC9BWU8_9POAL